MLSFLVKFGVVPSALGGVPDRLQSGSSSLGPVLVNCYCCMSGAFYWKCAG